VSWILEREKMHIDRYGTVHVVMGPTFTGINNDDIKIDTFSCQYELKIKFKAYVDTPPFCVYLHNQLLTPPMLDFCGYLNTASGY
jgi:hypothetical protein